MPTAQFGFLEVRSLTRDNFAGAYQTPKSLPDTACVLADTRTTSSLVSFFTELKLSGLLGLQATPDSFAHQCAVSYALRCARRVVTRFEVRNV